MTDSLPILYYLHDPMCSWCWGFRQTWSQVQEALSEKVDVQYVLAGLAADTDKPMSEGMQLSIRDTWRKIQQEIPGTEFNYDFWSVCQPRRSTYPACRAVVACGMQQPKLKNMMLLAIQQAYYLNARNPSDEDVLIKIAEEIGLDRESFERDLKSDECRKKFEDDLHISRDLYVHSFPSLVLSQGKAIENIHIDYTSSKNILDQIVKKLSG